MTYYITVVTYVFSFIIGACVGSAFLCFLDRRKRKESWLAAHSCCTACGHELSAFDLIPIASYLVLRGKCRYCKKPYPVSTLLSELASGLAFLFGACLLMTNIRSGNLALGVAQCLIFILLAFAAVNDIYCHECEYVFQYGILGIGLCYAVIFGQWFSLAMAAILGAILFLLNIIYLKVRHIPDAIGLADIIVCIGVACVLTPFEVPLMILFACVLSLFAIPLAGKNQAQQGMEEAQMGVGLLPFIMLGTFPAALIF